MARLQSVAALGADNISWILLRGVFSDVAAAVLLGALLAHTRPRWLGWLLTAVILFAYAGNSVNIRVNHANLSVGEAGMVQKEFLVSMLSAEVLRNFLMYLLVFAAGWYIAGRRYPQWKLRWPIGSALVLLASFLWWPVAITTPDWMQRSLPENNIAQMLHRNAAFVAMNASALASFQSHDLAGDPIVAPPQGHPNVLLIVLESMSGQFIERGWTPYIASLSQQTLFFPNFVDLQRQTHNGMYAMLCGDLPSLTATHSNGMVQLTNKWGEVVRTGTPYPCLPQRLKNAGYRTVFMKACDLNYVSTNIFAPRAGFDEAYDDSAFALPPEEKKRWYGWGAPDNVLFTEAFMHMLVLQREGKPWFMTLLTGGTHQPYNISPDYAARFGGDYEKASFAFMDESLGQLMHELDAKGILKNTVVLITGDESAADIERSDNAGGLMVANWGTLLIHLPSGETRVDDDYFRQSDIMLSVLDYLGLPSDDVDGRSLFRRYHSFRPLMFANTILGRWDVMPSPGRLVMCSAQLDNCGYYTLTGSLFHATAESASPDPAVNEYREAARASDARLERSNLLFSWDNPKDVSGSFTLLQFLRLSPAQNMATRMLFHLRAAMGNRHDADFFFNLQAARGPGQFLPSRDIVYRHPVKIASGKDVFLHVMIPSDLLAQDVEAFARIKTSGGDKVTLEKAEITRVPLSPDSNGISFTMDDAE